ncbi:MAG: hypothetical protein HC769_24755 [Cyanobacteria bacterium CRU_2_1]|nr:hypothetical protein [Cyanobacteria bacterium RU_5_0]NJR61759.1 hypothetical protein [Cyanobacteria bacterium CRU_2_1]
MVNIGFGMASILGIALALAGVGLYFLRNMRPALARDQDIFFAAIALLCGGILFFQGWRLDPILQFAQFLSGGAAVWFGFEAVRLRGIATEQAKRSTPVVDTDRPVSRVYRAELDNYPPPLDDRFPVNRRIRGARDSRAEEEDYTREDVRRPSSRRSSERLSDRPRKSRSSRPLPPDRSDIRDDWGNDFEERPARPVSRPSSVEDDRPARPRRNRPPSSSRRRSPASESSDYVDYQPIDYPDE